MVRALVLAAVLVLAACGGTAGRIARAADAMEHLRGVRFTIAASSVASGAPASGGDLALRYRAAGELAPPDRLRLTVIEPRPAVLVIAGRTATLDGQPASPTALRSLASPIAILEQLREPGDATFRGLGFAQGNVTARYRIDRRERGVVEVELGLLDDLVRRQTFTVSEAAPPDGSGLQTVRTTYVVEYRDFGTPVQVGEPGAP
jgi:hypothetical protein